MAEQYTKEQLWKLYENLPLELKETIFSEETSDSIWDICEKNNIDEVSVLGKLVGDTLMGILPPSELQKKLGTDLALLPEVARKTFQDVHRLILYPVQLELAKLYPTESYISSPYPTPTPIQAPIENPVMPKAPPVKETAEETTKEQAPKKKQASPKAGDTYRETIE